MKDVSSNFTRLISVSIILTQITAFLGNPDSVETEGSCFFLKQFSGSQNTLWTHSGQCFKVSAAVNSFPIFIRHSSLFQFLIQSLFSTQNELFFFGITHNTVQNQQQQLTTKTVLASTQLFH